MDIGSVLAQLFAGRDEDPAELMKQQVMAQAGASPPTPTPRPEQPPAPELKPPEPPVPDNVIKPPVAEAYKSPPDLTQLYMQQLERAQRNQNVGDAMTMIAAGITPHAEVRQQLLQTIGRGGGGSDGSSSMFTQIGKLREEQQAAADQQKMRAILPQLSKQYGVSMEALEGMLTGGTLEEFLNQASQPNNEITTRADGSTVLVDKTDGVVVKEISGAKPDPVEWIDNPSGKGGKIAVRKTKDGYIDVNTNKLISEIAAAPDPVEWIENPSGKGGKIAVRKTPDGYVDVNTNKLVSEIKPEAKQVRIESLADGTKQPVGEDGRPIGEPFGPKDPPVTTDDIKEWEADETDGKASGISLKQWILDRQKAGATKIDLGGEGELEKELGKKAGERWDTEYEAATGAASAIESIKTAKEQLEKGIVAGSQLSPIELEGRKVWADVFGLPDEAITNTETFQAVLKEVVLDKIKALGSGSGISNSDREYVNAAVAGSISMNEQSMKRILDIHEKVQTKKVEKYNKSVDEFMSDMDDDEKKRFRKLMRKINLPTEKKTVVIDGVTIEEE